MTKQEFLESLERHLRGQIPEDQVVENIEYYRSYIDRELAAGKTEAAVMELLGDPWLIAKTLIDSRQRTVQSSNVTYEYGNEEEEEPSSHLRKRKLDLTTWYGKLIVIAVAALVLFLLFTILSILVPVVLCLAAISFIIKFLRKR